MEKTNKDEENFLEYLKKMKKVLQPEEYFTFISGVNDLAIVFSQPFLVKYASGDDIGESYWVFRSQSSREEILRGLPVLFDEAQMPKNLELTLLDNLSEELKKLESLGSMESSSHHGTPYIIRGRIKGYSNKGVCKLMGDLVSTNGDWNDSANEPPFDFNSGSFERYYKAGDRFLEWNG